MKKSLALFVFVLLCALTAPVRSARAEATCTVKKGKVTCLNLECPPVVCPDPISYDLLQQACGSVVVTCPQVDDLVCPACPAAPDCNCPTPTLSCPPAPECPPATVSVDAQSILKALEGVYQVCRPYRVNGKRKCKRIELYKLFNEGQY